MPPYTPPIIHILTPPRSSPPQHTTPNENHPLPYPSIHPSTIKPQSPPPSHSPPPQPSNLRHKPSPLPHNFTTKPQSTIRRSQTLCHHPLPRSTSSDERPDGEESEIPYDSRAPDLDGLDGVLQDACSAACASSA